MKTISNQTKSALEALERRGRLAQCMQNPKGDSTAYYPAQHLSPLGNREEFHIPSTRLGNAICLFHLVWGKVEGRLQPCILIGGLAYPEFQPATGKEVYEDEA